jgi:hypothetical protein
MVKDLPSELNGCFAGKIIELKGKFSVDMFDLPEGNQGPLIVRSLSELIEQ